MTQPRRKATQPSANNGRGGGRKAAGKKRTKSPSARTAPSPTSTVTPPADDAAAVRPPEAPTAAPVDPPDDAAESLPANPRPSEDVTITLPNDSPVAPPPSSGPLAETVPATGPHSGEAPEQTAPRPAATTPATPGPPPATTTITLVDAPAAASSRAGRVATVTATPDAPPAIILPVATADQAPSQRPEDHEPTHPHEPAHPDEPTHADVLRDARPPAAATDDSSVPQATDPAESPTGPAPTGPAPTAAGRRPGAAQPRHGDLPPGAQSPHGPAVAQESPAPEGPPFPPPAPDGPHVGRIPVLNVGPVVDGGRWPAKAVVGEQVPITATVFREGHDAVGATAVLLRPDGSEHSRARMHLIAPGIDRYAATVIPDAEGEWSFRVEGWSDVYGTWEHDAVVKVAAEVDVDLMLEEGARVLEWSLAVGGHDDDGPRVLQDAVTALRDDNRPAQARLAAATAPEVHAVLAGNPLRDLVTVSPDYRLVVQRERALYSAWYELFPRSQGAYHDDRTGRWVSGTFATAAERLPDIAAMGFDIVYLPPIHPIGRVNRKGPNNTLNPAPGDPGSPWAIGSHEGGHDALHPDLGTFDDFDAFVAAARGVGLEVALDLALQCAPDHPWARARPEWFTTRADGTIAYAENPPKKYQDIYPLNFDNDPEGLAREIRRIVHLWIDHGVTVFRVDNPHTKPVWFWEWLLADVNRDHPEVLFLAEAFTRPAMMHTLGKIGFHQSYTYFTWRTTKPELTDYLTELSGEPAAYMRPNFWPNTPDILHEFLQYGGPAAFKLRAVLASTLSPSWGIYSGYELTEHVAVRQGSEEYLDSEKYQYRPRNRHAAEDQGRSIVGYLTQLNRARRDHPALHRLRNLKFHQVEDDSLISYSRRLAPTESPDGREDTLIVVVNLDPHGTRESMVHLDMPSLGMDWNDTFTVHDLLSGATYRWGEHNYVRLDPHDQPAHVLHVRRI
jgi:starch synthase (maltosyl-transferring)